MRVCSDIFRNLFVKRIILSWMEKLSILNRRSWWNLQLYKPTWLPEWPCFVAGVVWGLIFWLHFMVGPDTIHWLVSFICIRHKACFVQRWLNIKQSILFVSPLINLILLRLYSILVVSLINKSVFPPIQRSQDRFNLYQIYSDWQTRWSASRQRTEKVLIS